MMELHIEGLNQRQRIIADVLWSIDTVEAVEAFINSLTPDSQQEARVVMSMMTWAMLDLIDDTNLAEEALQKFL